MPASIDFEDIGVPGWWLATGSDLPTPVRVRFSRSDGRLHLTGLLIDSGEPITSALLRRIPVGQLAETYLDAMRVHLEEELRSAESEEDLFGLVLLDARRRRQLEGLADAPVAEWDPFFDTIEDYSSSAARLSYARDVLRRFEEAGEVAELTPRGRGAKPPTDAEYRAFARIYLEERALNEHGALSRTAKKWGVHRSTALRWLRSLPEGLFNGGNVD